MPIIALATFTSEQTSRNESRMKAAETGHEWRGGDRSRLVDVAGTAVHWR